MYRTATLSVFDVIDQVHVNAVIMEYPGMPGAEPPERIVFSTTVRGTGRDDLRIWLWEALQALQIELDQP